MCLTTCRCSPASRSGGFRVRPRRTWCRRRLTRGASPWRKTHEHRRVFRAAALTHDIGIREAERLYGQCGGKLQERLGPPEAQKMLDSLGFAPDVTERVCFLIAHHHTLDGVDALDWRILLEADFLVNMIEEGMKADAIQCGREKIFRTEMGLRLMERLTEKKCNS